MGGQKQDFRGLRRSPEAQTMSKAPGSIPSAPQVPGATLCYHLRGAEGKNHWGTPTRWESHPHLQVPAPALPLHRNPRSKH